MFRPALNTILASGKPYVPCIGGGEYMLVDCGEIQLLYDNLLYLSDPQLPLTPEDRMFAPINIVAMVVLRRLAEFTPTIDARTLGRARAAVLVQLGAICGRDPLDLSRAAHAWDRQRARLVRDLEGNGIGDPKAQARAGFLRDFDREWHKKLTAEGVLPRGRHVMRALRRAVRFERGRRASADDLDARNLVGRFYEMISNPYVFPETLRLKRGRITPDWSRIRTRITERGAPPRGHRNVSLTGIEPPSADDPVRTAELRDEVALVRRVLAEQRQRATARSHRIVLDHFEAIAGGATTRSALARAHGISVQALGRAFATERGRILDKVARFSG